MLDAANAVAADRALADVEAAVARLQKAIDGRFAVLTFITGAESAAAAADEDLRQSKSILEQLHAKRPGLTNEGVPGFLELAAAGGAVQAGVDAAHLLTGEGFAENVIAPTLASVKALGTIAGFSVGAILAVGVALFLLLRWDRS